MTSWQHKILLDEKWHFLGVLVSVCFVLMVLGVLFESAVLFMVGGCLPTVWAVYRAGKLTRLPEDY